MGAGKSHFGDWRAEDQGCVRASYDLDASPTITDVDATVTDAKTRTDSQIIDRIISLKKLLYSICILYID